MINNVTLLGRLTKEPEVRYAQGSDLAVCNFTLAVERDYKPQGADKPETDFINCTAFGNTAKFISTHFKKGNMLAVTGSIQTGEYTNKDGVKVYTTKVKVDKASFTGERKADAQQGNNQPPAYSQPPVDNDGFQNIPEGIDEELPFN